MNIEKFQRLRKAQADSFFNDLIKVNTPVEHNMTVKQMYSVHVFRRGSQGSQNQSFFLCPLFRGPRIAWSPYCKTYGQRKELEEDDA